MSHQSLLDPPAWFGIGLELAALTLLLLSLAFCRRHWSLSAENSRKLFHVGGGLSTLTFPWLFQENWPIVCITLLTIPTLLALKYQRSLKAKLGGVLYAVKRNSFGEIYFPISVCLIDILAGRNVLLFIIPILILTFADTVAALAGLRYGQTHYRAIGGYKSVEGSLAFGIMAFLSVLTPLLVSHATGNARALAIALLVATLVTIVEAIAWGGLDNLFIPLSAYCLLLVLMPMPLWGLIVELGLLAGLALLVLFWRSRVTLNNRVARYANRLTAEKGRR